MNDDYLWEGRGQPEADVKRLEEGLSEFRVAPQPLAIPDEEFEKLRQRGGFSGAWWRWPRLAPGAGALAVVALATGLWLSHRVGSEQPSWAVARLEGTPRVGATAVTENGRFAVGQWLETDAESRARIDVGDMGEVVVGPNSRLRLTDARAKRKQLYLEHGAMTARITAPPWLFYVDTPAATAVDLGCEYTLEADEKGNGLLRVTLGWVQLFDGTRQVMLPADSAAKMRHGFGPGTPYFEDTSTEFQRALEELDFGTQSSPERAAALSTVLSEARKKDALSLFPLLIHVQDEERGRVYDRLAELIPPPAGVTREGVLQHDRREIDLWWDNWGLGHPKK